MAEKISYRQMIPLGLTSFITPFMSSSLNLSIPSISAGFSAGAVSVGWVITIFLLFSTAFSVPFGRIADLYGKKRFLLSGASVFTAASLFCGMAPNLPVLLIGRAVQGFGASMIFATAMALISAIFPPSVRGRMMGISVTLTYLGLSLGPVLGGQLNHYFGWRSIFFFSMGAGILACLAIVLILKEPEQRHPDHISLDIPGIFLYLAAISMILYGLTELTSHSFAWLILAGGILVSVLFVRHELRAPSPLLNLSLFTGNRPFALSNLAALLNYGASYSVSYVLSIYLQNVRGFTPRSAGLLLITAPAVQALFSGFAGRLSDRHSPYKLASSGMALSGLGICML
ncbi:MAG: MFS transporter, partial [Firmicutes bacterium]|nr:MFS transporter [Bacillota bacterium]